MGLFFYQALLAQMHTRELMILFPSHTLIYWLLFVPSRYLVLTVLVRSRRCSWRSVHSFTEPRAKCWAPFQPCSLVWGPDGQRRARSSACCKPAQPHNSQYSYVHSYYWGFPLFSDGFSPYIAEYNFIAIKKKRKNMSAKGREVSRLPVVSPSGGWLEKGEMCLFQLCINLMQLMLCQWQYADWTNASNYQWYISGKV